MKTLKYLFLVVVALGLVLVALANRGDVGLKVLPEEMADYVGQPISYELPLFVVILASIVVGLLIGFVWEWFREHSVRVDARSQKREKEKLLRQLKGMKAEKHEGQDEVLALLDDAAAAR